jgi:hypothetical protein
MLLYTMECRGLCPLPDLCRSLRSLVHREGGGESNRMEDRPAYQQVSAGRGKEGGRAISVPWRYLEAGLYSHIMAGNTVLNLGCDYTVHVVVCAINVKYSAGRLTCPKVR